jgi:hypothetical protein
MNLTGLGEILSDFDWLWGLIFGALLSYVVEERRRRREKREAQVVAGMQVATQLRLWMEKVSSIVFDIANHDSSGGEIGKVHTVLPTPPFAESLDQVAKLPAERAEALFELVHSTNSINDQVWSMIDIVGGEEGVEKMYGLAGDIYIQTMPLYAKLANEAGWNAHPFVDYVVEKMQKAAATLGKRR